MGELYLELHRGTYTSQAFVKAGNRRMEGRLRETEALALLALQHGSKYKYARRRAPPSKNVAGLNGLVAGPGGTALGTRGRSCCVCGDFFCCAKSV